MNERFPAMRFRSRLRPSQAEAVEIARRQLSAGGKRIHIVAPPGSGKTVLGLYLWAEVIRRPAVVLSPNSAIQSQWADRTDLFETEGGVRGLVSVDPRRPGLLTSITYQSVTLPARGSGDLDQQALELWAERLVQDGRADDPDQASAWIADLARHNPAYHDSRLTYYRKEAREGIALAGDALATIHPSALATLRGLREHGVGLLILDECHHLLGHWGRVLDEAGRFLGEPVVLGLTATPPDRKGHLPRDAERYDAFLGPVDHEVPVPALVRDGFLAPYQDLAWFVRPSSAELSFIAGADQSLTEIVEDLCAARPDPAGRAETLPEWLHRVLSELHLPAGPAPDWDAFERRDPSFAGSARVFLSGRGLPLPSGVPPADPAGQEEPGSMDVLVPVLDRYVRHGLRTSAHPRDHEMAERTVRRLRVLGVAVTEAGARACASPVSRVLGYTRAKTGALSTILGAEMRSRGESIRAVVLTDFERSSAVSPEVSHLLDDEAGGAMAAFRALLEDEATDALDPVLVTGSSVLVDDDLAGAFMTGARQWLTARDLEVDLRWVDHVGFKLLLGTGSGWGPRVYVAMITDLFQRGLTRCLVGTRGLLGEGWDASKVNVLVDLTTVTTSMTVNQLRGRSIRLDPDDNNWDVVCVAPEFRKGLEDYRRFMAKHRVLFGVTDDGAIEKSVGHVHPAFTEIRPEGGEGHAAALNDEMLARASRRAEARALWRIGEPYGGKPLRAVEVRLGGGGGGFPPFAGGEAWSDLSLARAVGEAVLGALRDADLLEGPADLSVGELPGGFVRAFLRGADESAARLFADSTAEVLGPLRRPRYIVPRFVKRFHETWISQLLPTVIGRYFRKKSRSLVTWHAVPSALGVSRELAEIYQRWWNRLVSPGEVLFAHRGRGEEVLAGARRAGRTISAEPHRKDVFL
ncbi:MAG: DEAD/DEAH box helicase family protein [Planctomycetota bacterium]